MKIVITGGHLSPAFAVIKKLKKEEILFLGRKHALTDDSALSLEYQFCQNMGVSFAEIQTAKLQRKSITRTFLSLFKLPIGTTQALRMLKDFKPNVVLGFGGYISLPVIFAAKALNVPIVIHEQTLEAGIANKIAARLVDKICISWLSSQQFFPRSKTILTGNPVREELLKSGESNTNIFTFKNNLPVIYITGGSLGSHAINILIEEILPQLLKFANVIHQTGDAKKYADFERLSEKASENYILRKFFTVEELYNIYNEADLVVSRSGINTLTELMHFKKPAFLIPLPLGQKDEQLKNAMFYKRLGLAEVVLQKELNTEKFLAITTHMLKHIDKYKIDGKQGELVKKKAADEIIKVVKNVARS